MQQPSAFGRRLTMAAACAIVAGTLSFPAAQTPRPPAGTLDRVREAARIRLGYRADARPFSYRDETGRAAGYSVALCGWIVEELRREPGGGAPVPEWVAVSADDRFRAVQDGRVDVLCGADTVTLGRR